MTERPALMYRPKQVRTFLVLLLIFMAAATFKFGPRSGAVRPVAWTGEAVLVGFFLVWPKLFFPVFRLILKVSSAIGSAVFFIVTLIVFFVFITPASAVMRLFGKKFMLVRRDPSAASYFEPPADESDFHRQF
ncbi:MAG: hypothetical protein ACYDH3_10710 [Candidatus Aminicenantales bacterium]